MDRRAFLQQVAAWSAGTMAVAPLFRIVPQEVCAEAPRPSSLALARGEDYEPLVAAVLAPLGGMKAFVRPGDKVVVKPNIGWDRAPELAANTNPAVVASLVKLALAAGAAQVLVFDRSCDETRRCYANSGILPAVTALADRRADCPFIDNRKFVPVKIEMGKSLTQWPIYRDALEADCYINVPVAKHHGLAKLTLGLKNTMGVIGGNRGDLHHNIGQRLADLNTVVRSKLTVIDATRIMLRNGPTGGSPNDVKKLDTLIASADPVAADAYATTLFGMKPEEIGSTKAAYALGLGEMDLEKVRILQA